MCRTFARLTRTALGVVALAVLAACEAPSDFGECEPGVEDLSRTETVCP